MSWYPGKPKNKYGAKKVEIETHSFASGLEGALYQYLVLEMKAGIWKSIQPQDHVKLTRADVKYIADFKAICAKTGVSIWHEAKGFETDLWRVKRRLWTCYGPGELRVWKGTARRLYLFETIKPKAALCSVCGS